MVGSFEDFTRALLMAWPGLARIGACQDEGNDFVTVVGSSSLCSGHEASKYVTPNMDEVQIAVAIEKSREQGWSEVADCVREGVARASWSGVLSEQDRLLWEKLKKEAPYMFEDPYGSVKLGRVIAEGGQAHIYEASMDSDGIEYVAKVFKMEGFSLADLHDQWPRATKLPSNSVSRTTLGGVLFRDVVFYCSVLHLATFLNDGRFAFIGRRYWGDLRTLINLRLLDNNYGKPPFSNNEALGAMYHIAIGMKGLHERGVLHRDLKVANVLVEALGGDPRCFGGFVCYVADYESCMLIQGTGYWRAPELLEDLMKKLGDRNKAIWTEKVDAYGYAMICYEVLTGHTPFFGYEKSDWKRVIDGERPHLPDYVDPKLQELVERCWHKDPLERPTFEAIVLELCTIRCS